MKRVAENFGIALCGFATSILVAIADVTVARISGFDLFTLSVWFVLPVGALLTGCAAASGYYFGALYFHKRTSKILLLQMVLIAAFSQFLIYWLRYTTLVLDDGRKVADFLPFLEYLKISLTKAHYSVTRPNVDMGEMGVFAYVLAVLRFFGYLAGAAVVYSALRAKPVCQPCKRYLRPLAKKYKSFGNADDASAYFDKLFSYPMDGKEFSDLIRTTTKTKDNYGAYSINTVLLGCPQCKAQVIDEKVSIRNDRDWVRVEHLDRRVRLPNGVDVARVFRSKPV